MLRRFGVNYAIFSIVLDIMLTLVALLLAPYLVRYIPTALNNLRGPSHIAPYTC